MEKIDLTQKIMKKVVTFEKRRIIKWIVGIFLGFTIVLTIAAFSFIFIAQDLITSRSLDLLTLFGEDWEIIKEFWQETMVTFWEGLPHEALLIALISLILVLVLILAVVRHLPIIKKKISGLQKYQKIAKIKRNK